MITLTLPTPPSTNRLFRNVPGRGRVKTTEYTSWINTAGWSLASQLVGQANQIPGKVKVSILFRRTRGDLDNLVKPVLDLLVKHGTISDDRHVEAVSARWSDQTTGCLVLVEAA